MEKMSIKDKKKGLETLILAKLDKIKTNVITWTSGNDLADARILSMVSDELDDVLLNWVHLGTLGEIPSSLMKDDLIDDDEDDDDDGHDFY